MPDGGNIAMELAEDHAYIQGLLTQAMGLSPGDSGRRGVINEASVWLLRHTSAEERFLYPAIREHLPEGDGLALEQELERVRIVGLIEGVAERENQDEVFEELLQQLFVAVGVHITALDTTLLPMLLDTCLPEEAEDLGSRIRSVKRGVRARPMADPAHAAAGAQIVENPDSAARWVDPDSAPW
jgi:hypothetical protein